MVKTKSVYDPVKTYDGNRILAARYWPRGISRKRLSITNWLRNLAPSEELLRDWKEQRISWEDYIIRYHKEMRGQRQAIRDLAIRAMRGTITLPCFEPEDDPCCHRHLLKKLIEKEQQGEEANI